MIQVAEAFVDNGYMPAPLHANAFYKHANELLDEIHYCHWEEGKERFLTFALFHETKI